MSTKRVRCAEVVQHLCGDLDEKIDSPSCRALKKHLEECPDCTAYLDSLKKTITLYRRYPEPRPSATRREKLMSVLKLR